MVRETGSIKNSFPSGLTKKWLDFSKILPSSFIELKPGLNWSLGSTWQKLRVTWEYRIFNNTVYTPHNTPNYNPLIMGDRHKNCIDLMLWMLESRYKEQKIWNTRWRPETGMSPKTDSFFVMPREVAMIYFIWLK